MNLNSNHPLCGRITKIENLQDNICNSIVQMNERIELLEKQLLNNHQTINFVLKNIEEQLNDLKTFKEKFNIINENKSNEGNDMLRKKITNYNSSSSSDDEYYENYENNMIESTQKMNIQKNNRRNIF